MSQILLEKPIKVFIVRKTYIRWLDYEKLRSSLRLPKELNTIVLCHRHNIITEQIDTVLYISFLITLVNLLVALFLAIRDFSNQLVGYSPICQRQVLCIQNVRMYIIIAISCIYCIEIFTLNISLRQHVSFMRSSCLRVLIHSTVMYSFD